MTRSPFTLFRGEVVHARLRPRRHRLTYRVFALGVDVDRLAEASTALRLTRYNRFGLLGVHDRDHGDGKGHSLAAGARDALAATGLAAAGCRIEMISYPRVLGYVFNPLSVFLCHDDSDRLAAVIYEVSNTVGERTSYVVEAGDERDGVYAQSCAKQMYVSPFTPARLDYGFRIARRADRLTIGVNLRDAEGALLRAHFAARAEPLTDRAALAAIASMPLMTLKVMAAIHLEALKLYLKGVPVVRHHVSPRYSVVGAKAENI